MKVYSGAGLGDFYFDLIRDITEHGRKIQTRGHECLELSEPVTLVYEKPGHCWMTIPGRKWNPFLALAEVVWILSGNGSVEWISYFSKYLINFADFGNPNFHGAYGLRIRNWPNFAWSDGLKEERLPVDQIGHVLSKLKKDPFSRQAVISLWDPVRDNHIKSNDYPCNNLVYFSLRDRLLDQTVVIRSNDVVWGTTYNAVQFTHIQAYIAGCLGVKMGKLTYVIQNLHYYFDLYKPTLALLLERAYEQNGNPGAHVVPNFDVATDEIFEITKTSVENILADQRAGISFTSHHFASGGLGYWGLTIPQMIWVYSTLKEKKVYTPVEIGFLIERIISFGEPFTSLVLDFYKDSERQIMMEIVKTCRRMLLPLHVNSES